jgi:uncharacterized repeat protein (TIGR03803 family)
MAHAEQQRSSAFARLAGMAGLLILLVTAIPVRAQTFTIIHNFTGGADGGFPYAGPTIDHAGNLYGTAASGGNSGSQCNNLTCGTVFKLTRKNSSWLFTPLYAFSGPDGANPEARVIIGPDGSLYGTTVQGGVGPCTSGHTVIGCGTVFKLTPSATACKTALCPWTETVLYSFQGSSDGQSPGTGDLLFDQAGNIYGTTSNGGDSVCDCGTVFELTPSHGSWTESVLYRFLGNNDGALPYGGVIFDAAGNLYGTTVNGGATDGGTVFTLMPSGSGWTETVLHSFNQLSTDGSYPSAGLISDQSGNFYGTTPQEGKQGGGTVYELTPSNGGWTFNVLYSFTAYEGSFAKLAMDAAGNLYGTLLTAEDEVFRLTPSNGGWTQTGFTGSGGANSYGSVVVDKNGNVYTTASAGGAYEHGTVFEITP